MLLWDLQKYGDLPAVVTEQGDCYSYHDLDQMQKEFASHIQLDLLVCIFADNNLAALTAYLSCLAGGTVSLLIPAVNQPGPDDPIIQEYQPDYIWLPVEQHQKDETGWSGYREVISYFGYVLLECKSKGYRNLHPDLALLLPTSGSTGNPRLVRLSRHNLWSNTVSICGYMELTRDDRAVTSLPLGYTYGLSVVNTILYSGGSLFLTKESSVSPAFWKHMDQYGVTVLSGVPYTYQCMEKLNINISSLKKLRTLTQAGGKLPEELQMYWGDCATRTGKHFFVMYGQTEATARIAYLPWQDCLRKPGSVGVAIPDSELELVDREGNRIMEAYHEGEIICRGGHVSMGYAGRKEDLALGDVNRGCLYTGDTGHFDEDGYLYIDGRMNRFAKIYGKRTDLGCVEKAASGIWGQEVTALSDDRKIYLYTDADVTADALVQLGRDTGLGREVMEIRRMEEIPRQYNGKVDYRMQLSQALQNGG